MRGMRIRGVDRLVHGLGSLAWDGMVYGMVLAFDKFKIDWRGGEDV